MGADITVLNPREHNHEPRADLLVRHSKLRSIRVDRSLIPQLIDEIPVLAVLASQADGTSEILDAAELRVKESDRLAAIAFNLRNMGGEVEEGEDYLRIRGPRRLTATTIDSFGDHRIAMAFAVAALLATEESTVHQAECADISFPNFFRHLQELTD
jgi:3-phosphoshikimate 1-carboxyvinyltransferase